MNEDTSNVTSIQAPADQAEPEATTCVTFSKPYTFEGKTYTGIDLGGLENLTAQDMVDAEKFLTRSGIISPIPELTVEYVCFVANRATGQPVEFFKGLPPRDVVRVKNKVTGFFYGEG